MGRDDGLADVQAQPQAAARRPTLRRCPWRPVEQLPHARPLRLGQARPTVAHCHARPAPARRHNDVDRPVRGRVLERVRHVIRDHLADAVGVGLDRDRRAAGRRVQADRAIGRRHAQCRHLLAHQRRQVAWRAVELQLARADRRRVEEQGEQPRQPRRALVRVLQAAAHSFDLWGERGARLLRRGR